MGVQPVSGDLHSAQQESSASSSSIAKQPPAPSSQEGQDGQRQKQTEASSSGTIKDSPRPRRFLPQPVETSSRSSASAPRSTALSDPPSHEPRQDKGNTPRRFLPEPVETTKLSNHGLSSHTLTNSSTHAAPAGPRRFKPELIETDRQTNEGTGKEAFDQPDQENGFLSVHSQPNIRHETYPRPMESKFSYASLLRRQEGRRHSFRIPELPSIPSNSSEDSSDSPTSSPSPVRSSSQSLTTPLPHALDENSKGQLSEYMLALAARSAHKQLKDQALAAFPNEQSYEPVDHFAVDDEGDDAEFHKYPQAHHIKSRRQSSVDLSWELEYMRQHKEEAEQRFRMMIASGKRLFDSVQSNPAPTRNERSPPMLGSDIIIPRSVSPEGTLCHKSRIENDSQATQSHCTGCDGLWCASSHADRGRGSGLWKGTCQKNENNQSESGSSNGKAAPKGLFVKPDVTKTLSLDLPRPQRQQISTSRLHQSAGPSSPTGTSSNLLDELDDEFVTQIYNYLSLGYPCVARYYDDELSLISGITITDLRHDDLRTDAKGYVVAPDDSSSVVCSRWEALRVYIREWALRQPQMGESDDSAWGMPERKGSWAF